MSAIAPKKFNCAWLNNKSALASSGESALGLAKSSSWVVSQDWNKNPEIKVKDKEVLNENYTLVASVLVGTSERPEVNINWRVYTKNPDNPLIRDLIIEGLSLARTQKEEFTSILNSNDGDIKVLFKILEEFSKK